MRTIAGPKEDYHLTELCTASVLDVGNASGRTLVCDNRPKGRLSTIGPYCITLIN